jgi:hypothetical protein
MKLSTQSELEVKLLEQQIRFYLIVNGILGASMFIGIAMLLYKIMKAIFE